MSKIFNVTDILPLYVLESGVPKLIDDKSNFCVDFDYIPEWVKENHRIGQIGEFVVSEYLKNIYSLVEWTSVEDSSAGYDIICDKRICFEVKTSLGNSVSFYITRNELEVSAEKKGNYSIFYVGVNESERKVTGYIINDPISFLKINLTDLFNVNYAGDRCELEINSVKVNIDFQTLSECETVDLEKYWFGALSNGNEVVRSSEI